MSSKSPNFLFIRAYSAATIRLRTLRTAALEGMIFGAFRKGRTRSAEYSTELSPVLRIGGIKEQIVTGYLRVMICPHPQRNGCWSSYNRDVASGLGAPPDFNSTTVFRNGLGCVFQQNV